LEKPDSPTQALVVLVPTATALVLIAALVRRHMRPVPIHKAGINRAAVLKAMIRER